MNGTSSVASLSPQNVSYEYYVTRPTEKDSLIGTGFPFRKDDNVKRYMKIFEEMVQSCAGLRRPGAAALDLCYVAAGYYDGFFEMNLHPWDIAAGSLIITEAGGLVGNFSGESDDDFLFQREIIAATPRVYGQMVQILSSFSRVIRQEELTEAEKQELVSPLKPKAKAKLAKEDEAGAEAAEDVEKVKKAPVRIKKADYDAEKAALEGDIKPRSPRDKDNR